MDKYERDIRPSKNYYLTLNVTFSFSLAQIIDVVSESRNSVSFMFHLKVYEALRFNLIYNISLKLNVNNSIKTLKVNPISRHRKSLE